MALHADDYIRDFAERTRRNLEVIEEHARTQAGRGVQQVYEVTQLINSMLGLLVFPQQRYFDNIPRTPLGDLVAQGWPRVRLLAGSPPCDNLSDLMRHLRNAISHFGLTFVADPDTQHISGIRLRDKHPRTGDTTFEGELTLEEMRQITRRFVDLILAEGTR